MSFLKNILLVLAIANITALDAAEPKPSAIRQTFRKLSAPTRGQGAPRGASTSAAKKTANSFRQISWDNDHVIQRMAEISGYATDKFEVEMTQFKNEKKGGLSPSREKRLEARLKKAQQLDAEGAITLSPSNKQWVIETLKRMIKPKRKQSTLQKNLNAAFELVSHRSNPAPITQETLLSLVPDILPPIIEQTEQDGSLELSTSSSGSQNYSLVVGSSTVDTDIESTAEISVSPRPDSADNDHESIEEPVIVRTDATQENNLDEDKDNLSEEESVEAPKAKEKAKEDNGESIESPSETIHKETNASVSAQRNLNSVAKEMSEIKISKRRNKLLFFSGKAFVFTGTIVSLMAFGAYTIHRNHKRKIA